MVKTPKLFSSHEEGQWKGRPRNTPLVILKNMSRQVEYVNSVFEDQVTKRSET